MNLNPAHNFRSEYSIEKKSQIYKSENISKTNNQTELDNFFSDNLFKVIQTRVFDLQDNINTGKRTYLKTFEKDITNYVAVEVLILNPYFEKRSLYCSGHTIWYIEDEEVGRNNFNLEVKSDWDIVELVQSWGTPLPGFWKTGKCKVEVFLENKLVCTQLFSVGNIQIIDFQNSSELKFEPNKDSLPIESKNALQIKQMLDDKNSLDSVIQELNNFVGLKTLKNSLLDFITYLNFIQERNKQGIETNENISAHCIFLGNPGTGKTSIARLLGKYFKSIGLLEHGHVIEVDRSALVGEYIGETAQKTEKVINQALGGILFIDEAYSLKRVNGGNDFGQEAIDIILKRMEDAQGKFFVIAAGYPDTMQNFLESNPGLKSRFTHLFKFDNYSPEELTEIFKLFAMKEKFIVTPEAEKSLTDKLKSFCDNVDETFGNARFVRNLFNETKVQLGKRYQTLEYDERTFSTLSTIEKEDILSAYNNYLRHSEGKVFSEANLDKYLKELNNLIGLDDVKYMFNKLLASIKVDKLKKERSIAAAPKNLNSIFISEQGAGTTTVARLLGKIFKELSLLENGQLVEIDSSAFYGLSKIDAFLMLDKIFQDSVGKIILINDSILTLQANSDFSDSLLQYFLKKLYLYKDKLAAILTGTSDEIEELIANVPVIENQFPNIFNFRHYSTRQLLEIALNICQKKNYQLEEGAWQQMLEVLTELRKDRNRNFYNARTVKEILNKAIANQEERILSIPHPKDAELMTLTFEDFPGLL